MEQPPESSQEHPTSEPGNPFRLQLSAEGRHLQLVFEPGSSTTAFGANDILDRIQTEGYGDWLIHKDAIAKIPKQASAAQQPLIVDIAEKQDAEASLHISSDEMTATLTIVPAHGGAQVTGDELKALCARHGILRGLDQEAIASALANQSADDLMIAHGTPPAVGDDTRFESLLPEITDRRPREKEDGTVDYRDLGMFVTVKPNTPLMRRIPFTNGTAGTSVTGKIVLAKPGRDLNFATPLAGAVVDANDKDLLIATIGGQPAMVERGVRVDPVINIKNVDLSSGNVDFDGTVNVSGDVAAGLRIRTTGDIFVAGSLEGAILESGGNIKINKGVIGRGELRDANGTLGAGIAHIKAEGSVQARFFENAVIEARGDVFADELLAHCEVYAQGALVVGRDRAKKGHIIGGSATAVRGIKAQVIGSQAGVRTKLEAGMMRILRARLDEIRDALIANCAERDKLVGIVAKAAQLPAEIVERARATLAHAEEELKKHNAERDAMQQQLMQDSFARISVGVKVYDGVVVLLGERTVVVEHERGPGFFALENGEIVYTTQ